MFKNQFRPVIQPKVWQAIQRYATAHNIGKTAAANQLLTKALTDLKYLEKTK